MALWTPLELGTSAFRLGLRAMDTDGLNGGAEITRVGSAVSQWSDWSGNANHFTQATSGAQPTYSASLTELGSKPGVVWDGTDDFLGRTVNYFGDEITVFTVLATGDYKGSLYEQGASAFNEDFNFINFDRSFRAVVDTDAANQAQFLSEDFTNPHIYAARMGGAARTIYIDGYTRATNTTAQTLSSSSGITRIGATLWDGEFSSMSVGEYVVIQGVLTQANREKVEGYLAWKWGLQANLDALHPYKSAAPTVAGGTAYSLTAAAGSYVLTGQAAGALKQSRVTADAGAYALTGVAAGLTKSAAASYSLTAEPGAYTLTGIAANTRKSTRMAAEAGAYALTGVAANLLKTTAGAYVLLADTGVYTLNGVAAGLTKTSLNAYTLTAEPGSYSFTGLPTVLTADIAFAWVEVAYPDDTWTQATDPVETWTEV